jgi:hypothetical protein
MSEDLDDADLTIALDIIDIRLRTLDIAAQSEMPPEGVLTLGKYFFNYALTGLIEDYPFNPDGTPKKPKPKLVK